MQIDFILFPRAMPKLVTDVKVIPGEEVALQRQLLVCDMRFGVPPKPKRKFTPSLKVWKLTDPQRRNHFQEVFKLHVSASAFSNGNFNLITLQTFFYCYINQHQGPANTPYKISTKYT